MNKQIKSEIFSSFFKGLEELYDGQNKPYSFEIAELFINTLNKYDEAGVNVLREKEKPDEEYYKIITRGVCSPPIAGGVIPSPARVIKDGNGNPVGIMIDWSRIKEQFPL